MAAGLPTYVVGGRGYWSHPQVIELVAYLRALASPLDTEALYTVLRLAALRSIAGRARVAPRPVRIGGAALATLTGPAGGV